MIRTIILSLALLAGHPQPSQDTPKDKEKTSYRCEAITKKGTRCKNKAKPNSKYCRVHQIANDSTVKKCKAITKAGARCSRPAKTDGYCTQHYNMYSKGH